MGCAAQSSFSSNSAARHRSQTFASEDPHSRENTLKSSFFSESVFPEIRIENLQRSWVGKLEQRF